MTNVLLNIYEFQADWAKPELKRLLHPAQQVAILTMSHGNEIPDQAAWEALYRPGPPVYNVFTEASRATGGLPDVFYDRLTEWGLAEPIQAFPGIVMGCSAGAMVQMTEYHITPDEDYDSYSYHPGLGLLEGFEPEVHYAASTVQKESIARYLRERGKPVYAMTNQGGLVVEDGSIIPMGEVTRLTQEAAL